MENPGLSHSGLRGKRVASETDPRPTFWVGWILYAESRLSALVKQSELGLKIVSYLQSRKTIVDLLKARRNGEASNFALNAAKKASRFSTDHLYALADYYAVAKFCDRPTPALEALFSPKFIGHANLRELYDGDVDAINDAFEAELLDVGYQQNPRPKLGIDGKDKLIIDDQGFDRSREPIRTLLPVFDKFIQNYLTLMRTSGYPEPMLDDVYRYRLFAAATKGNGFHPPHLHSRAGFVFVYYIRVHPSGEATLQFGAHNMLFVKPFYEVVPREGDIFIFPSFFMHGSTATKVDKLRINIGMELEPEGIKPA